MLVKNSRIRVLFKVFAGMLAVAVMPWILPGCGSAGGGNTSPGSEDGLAYYLILEELGIKCGDEYVAPLYFTSGDPVSYIIRSKEKGHDLYNSDSPEAPLNVITLDRVRITFYRTDGGTVAPDPLDMTTVNSITGEGELKGALSFDSYVTRFEPFPSFIANGSDVETGLPYIHFDLLFEFYFHDGMGHRTFIQGIMDARIQY